MEQTLVTEFLITLFSGRFVDGDERLTSTFQKSNQVKYVLPLQPILKLHVRSNSLSRRKVIQVSKPSESSGFCSLRFVKQLGKRHEIIKLIQTWKHAFRKGSRFTFNHFRDQLIGLGVVFVRLNLICNFRGILFLQCRFLGVILL